MPIRLPTTQSILLLSKRTPPGTRAKPQSGTMIPFTDYKHQDHASACLRSSCRGTHMIVASWAESIAETHVVSLVFPLESFPRGALPMRLSVAMPLAVLALAD